ncbi:GNAT family N-acetyltransferase [Pediococcus sp. M21F004]|uniref:GNAT family N-acetyltransferase n=1 Tax=Pediococcus sp. M21F004 TaxID=3390033 RepID=UPI003DA75116
MEKFEKYRPILTPHFTLDWLTATKVKDIYTLRHDENIAKMSDRTIDPTIQDTVDYVNQAMRLIMNNDSLLWGISDRKIDEFLGTFCIWNFNDPKTAAEIRFEILPNQQNHGIMTEILQHMTEFAFNELGLTTLYAVAKQANTPAITILKKTGFEIDPTYPGGKNTLSFSISKSV